MNEVSDSRIGTLLDGRYRITERLAAGGMGVVYRGELTAIGKPVAVKFLHDGLAIIPDLVKRFQREATAMSKLGHPHLVGVIDSGLAAGVPYLVMDFVPGRTLADLLTAGALPAARAVGIARQILAGVKHAHASGVVHRDLKPDNILLLDDVEGDFVKILDFGLARVVHSEETQLTNTGFAMGTPGYMSPEQAKGTTADERSDLYAVGVILFHMVTGRKPFVADSPLAVLRMHMDDAPPAPNALAPRSCSPVLERVILRAMAKEPAARWQTAAELSAALAQTPEAAGAAPPGVDDEPALRRGRGARWLVRLAGVAMVAALVVAGWARLSRRQQASVRRQVTQAMQAAQGALDEQRRGGEPAAGTTHAGKSTQAKAAKWTQAASAPATNAPSVKAQVASAPSANGQTANAPSVNGQPANAPSANGQLANAPSANASRATAYAPNLQVANASPTNANAVSGPTARAQAANGAAPNGATAAAALEPAQAAMPATVPTATTAAANDEAARTPTEHAPAASAPAANGQPAASAGDDDDEEDDGAEPVAPSDTPGAKLEEDLARGGAAATVSAPEQAAPVKVAPSTHEAQRLMVAGHVDEAIRMLYEVRRRSGHTATAALLLGHAYFRKLWRTDGLREYDAAIKLAPLLKHNRELVHNVVAALDDPTYRLARAVIRARLGTAALPEVRRAARSARSPRVQKRAARLAATLAHRRR